MDAKTSCPTAPAAQPPTSRYSLPVICWPLCFGLSKSHVREILLLGICSLAWLRRARVGRDWRRTWACVFLAPVSEGSIQPSSLTDSRNSLIPLSLSFCLNFKVMCGPHRPSKVSQPSYPEYIARSGNHLLLHSCPALCVDKQTWKTWLAASCL